MKNAKKVLTIQENYAKIVNCIIIAHAMRSMTKSDNLYSSNMHKNRSKSKESTAAKEGLPERYQIFEWSD